MNPYCIKSLMFTKTQNITVKGKIDGLYVDCRFKKFKTINKEKLSYLL